MRVSCNKEGIRQAVRVIKEGGVTVFPTDTVYGIGCDPYSKRAVEEIYKIKSRDVSKSVPVLAYSEKVASQIVDFDDATRRIVKKFWPGPLTVVLKLTDKAMRESLNLEDKIAIRVPDSKCVLEILKECHFLVGTSANVSGNGPYTNPDECFKNLQGYDIFVDGGTIPSMTVSTIIEVKEEVGDKDDRRIKVLREGAVSEEEIVELL